MNYLNLIAAAIVAVAIIISKLIDSADARRTCEALERISEDSRRRAEKTAYAAEETRLSAESTRRTAVLNAKIEELKLERTRLLQNLSETDREAFEKLLSAPLIEKKEIQPVQVPVPVPYPLPWWVPPDFSGLTFFSRR